jgi:EAL domain-containing protein (putative c-di-GMP-specific phosphodiesterase class I)
MGAVSQSQDLRLALRSSAHADIWSDPSGIRGAMRHGLGGPASAVVFGAAVVGALSGAGNQLALALLAVAAGAQLLVPALAQRLGRPLTAETTFRIGLVGWPASLLVLGAAGRGADRDLYEVVAVLGFAIAALVALAESRRFSVAWAGTVAAGMLFGSALTRVLSFQTLLIVGSIAVGTLAGDRLREVLEAFLGARSRLMRDVSRVPVSDDPFVTAELLLMPLVRWTPLTSIAITWFRQDGRSVILGAAGEGLPAVIAAGYELPESRAREIRDQAQHGPWISGWTVRSDDNGYTHSVAAAGIKAAVYVPLVFEGRVVGTVGAGLTDRGDDRSAMAEYLPTLVQFADAAALELGPSLSKRDLDSNSKRAIDEILEGGGYWPVFQPVRRLTDGRTVGYEALSRFDATWTPSQIFGHARLSGRLHELELATLRAAAAASIALPAECWISFNCSEALLLETATLAEVLEPVRQEVVIELSEQDVIADYAPIGAAVARLGPRRRLAVDDAGAGFASLRHILEVRPQFVKLDIGLVEGVAADITRTALVAGFVRFATDAGFDLIAEGIETDADRRALRRLGVRFGQGYLLGRPMRPDAFDQEKAAAALGNGRRVRSIRHDPRGARLNPGAQPGH